MAKDSVGRREDSESLVPSIIRQNGLPNEATGACSLLYRKAAAQLAILLVNDDSEQSLETRLNAHEYIEEDNNDRYVNVYLVLSKAEREMLPNTTFVVDSIAKAIAIRIPPTAAQAQAQSSLRCARRS